MTKGAVAWFVEVRDTKREKWHRIPRQWSTKALAEKASKGVWSDLFSFTRVTKEAE